MKSLKNIFLIAFLTVSTMGISKIVPIEENDDDQEFIENIKQLREFCVSCPENVPVKFPAKTKLNFFINADSNIIAFDKRFSSHIEILKPFFVKRMGGTLLFSWDGVEWKEMTDFITGLIEVALAIEDNRPVIKLNLQAHPK